MLYIGSRYAYDALREREPKRWAARGIGCEIEPKHVPHRAPTGENVLVAIRGFGIGRNDKPGIAILFDIQEMKIFESDMSNLEELPVDGLKKKIRVYPDLFKEGPLQVAFEQYLAGAPQINVEGGAIPSYLAAAYTAFSKVPRNLPNDADTLQEGRELWQQAYGALTQAFANSREPPEGNTELLVEMLTDVSAQVHTIVGALAGDDEAVTTLKALGLELKQDPSAVKMVENASKPYKCPFDGCLYTGCTPAALASHTTRKHRKTP